ncbi:hypothetical protein AGIG_G12005 [Arapaima gigas]
MSTSVPPSTWLQRRVEEEGGLCWGKTSLSSQHPNPPTPPTGKNGLVVLKSTKEPPFLRKKAHHGGVVSNRHPSAETLLHFLRSHLKDYSNHHTADSHHGNQGTPCGISAAQRHTGQNPV